MAIIISEQTGSSNYEQVKAGSYIARCYQIIEIGTIKEEYNGEVKESKKVRIGFELPLELRQFKEGEPLMPMSIGKEFTMSLHEKSTLRKFLESWRGKSFTPEELKAFDLTKLISVPCLLTISSKINNEGKEYTFISGIGLPIKGVEVPKQFNQSFILDYSNFDFEKLKKVSLKTKEKIESTPEFKKVAEQYLAMEFERQRLIESSQNQNK